MEAGQKTESILSLVKDVEDGNIVLPEFQRDFVWDIEKTLELFDSFVREIFVGSLIYGSPSFEIAVREIDNRPRKGKGSRKKLAVTFYKKEDLEVKVRTKSFRLLLDGQQRTTAIYRALTGLDNVYFVVKDTSDFSNNYQEEIGQLPLEDLLQEFSSEPSTTNINVSLHDVFLGLTHKLIRDKDRLQRMIATNQGLTSNASEIEQSKEAEIYLHTLEKLQNLFRKETLLSYYLLDTNAEKFALFFERSNSKGMQLNFIDILAAKLYVGFNLREKTENFRERYPDHKISQESIVRAISFIVSKGRNIGRSFILNELSHEHFTAQWEEITEIFIRAQEYLKQQRLLISPDFLPYENLLIPLALFIRKFSRRDLSLMSKPQATVLHCWYWLSIFSRRYSQGALGSILEDGNFLEEVANSNFSRVGSHLGKLIPRISEPEDFFSIRKNYDALYRGIQNLMFHASDGVISLHTGKPVAIEGELEDHHIFPKDYLKKIQSPDIENTVPLEDCIANKTLIPKLANIRISNKAPSVYLQEILKQNTELREALDKHFIPPQLLNGIYDKDFDKFLEVRAALLYRLVEDKVSIPSRRMIDYFLKQKEI